MSLKALHLVFVTASTLMGFFVGGWGIKNYRADGSVEALILGILSIVLAIGMIWYGKIVLKKLRNIGFI